MLKLALFILLIANVSSAALMSNFHRNIAYKVACAANSGTVNCKFPKNINNPYWYYPISQYIRTTLNICTTASAANYNGTGFTYRWTCASTLPFSYKSPGYPTDAELFVDETKTNCIDTSTNFKNTLTDSSISVAELNKHCKLGVNFSLLSVSPSSGISGTELTITGYELGRPINSDITVSVGGSPCTPVIYDTDGKIRCTTTAHSPGLVNIVVNRGGLSATITNGYLYL
jgi:hypothetical protein